MNSFKHYDQPPSGGCVLKRLSLIQRLQSTHPAAFGRLCVETILKGVSNAEYIASRLRAAVC